MLRTDDMGVAPKCGKAAESSARCSDPRLADSVAMIACVDGSQAPFVEVAGAVRDTSVVAAGCHPARTTDAMVTNACETACFTPEDCPEDVASARPRLRYATPANAISQRRTSGASPMVSTTTCRLSQVRERHQRSAHVLPSTTFSDRTLNTVPLLLCCPIWPRTDTRCPKYPVSPTTVLITGSSDRGLLAAPDETVASVRTNVPLVGPGRRHPVATTLLSAFPVKDVAPDRNSSCAAARNAAA